MYCVTCVHVYVYVYVYANGTGVLSLTWPPLMVAQTVNVGHHCILTWLIAQIECLILCSFVCSLFTECFLIVITF